LNDLASILARPRPLTVGGATYDVYPLTIDDFAKVQEWVEAQFPDPFDVANRQIEAGKPGKDEDGNPSRVPYTLAQQQFFYRTALDLSRARHPLGTPEADELVRSVEGAKFLLWLSIAKGRPGFRREDAARLYEHLTMGDLARVFAATDADKVLSDPKDPATDGTGTPAP
jgi:hypothetical protein